MFGNYASEDDVLSVLSSNPNVFLPSDEKYWTIHYIIENTLATESIL